MSSIINGSFVLVSRAFGRYSVDHLIMFLRNAIAMVTGNVPFTGITPTPVSMTATVDDLAAKALLAMNGGRVEFAGRRAAQLATLTAARQWANFIEANCDGSLETLLSSGFEARKAPTPKVLPAVPGNVRLSYTDFTGELLLRFRGGRNDRNFSVQYAVSPDGPWTDVPLSSSTRVVISGLTAGTKYWVRVKANAAAGSSEWTAPTCKMAV
ncbi:MAG TPA: fibronectin type III domain-containing protein [Chthoniobacterales bacterium]|nr:fibronectin type III domain-containing protein [Chthoniobacterales bacterium]